MDPSAELPLPWAAKWLAGVHPVPLLPAPARAWLPPGDALQTGEEWTNPTCSPGLGQLCSHCPEQAERNLSKFIWFQVKIKIIVFGVFFVDVVLSFKKVSLSHILEHLSSLPLQVIPGLQAKKQTKKKTFKSGYLTEYLHL